MTHWTLVVSPTNFAKSIGEWAIFAVHDMPDINLFKETYIVNSGVTWSLPYEWMFYFSLPLISLLILKTKPNYIYIAISILYVIYFFTFQNSILKYGLYSFVGGSIAPILLKYTDAYRKINNTYASLIIIICAFGILQIRSGNSTICIALVTVIFTLVALGNSLFGLLKSSTLKLLGDISYSTYLLHGIILYFILHFVVGVEKIKHFTQIDYCYMIFSIAPIVVLISFLGYRFIEKPFMDLSKKINK